MARAPEVYPLRDPVKKTLLFPKLILETNGFWPEHQTLLLKIINWIILSYSISTTICQIVFVFSNITDLALIASAISTISTSIQGITKAAILYFYNAKLRRSLSVVWYKFWPAHIASSETKDYLKEKMRLYRLAAINMCAMGGLYGLAFVTAPILSKKKQLLFEGLYPFDWDKSPIFEIFYVSQVFANITFNFLIICGSDYLFMGFCANLIGQYILLIDVIKNLGRKNASKPYEKFIPEIIRQDESNVDENFMLLKVCIKHHVVLLEMCKEVAEIFSGCCAIQLLASVMGIVIACLIFTFKEFQLTLYAMIGFYVVGHMVQLFLYCSLSSELTYYANRFSEKIFSSYWYNIDNLGVKKDMLFVIMRAQKDVKLSALGIKPLNYETFIGVLKLSFSFYTMLSTIATK